MASLRPHTPSAWILGTLLATSGIAATVHNHFQVVGLSDTHVALRETFDDAEPSRLAHCGYRMGPGVLREHGVRLHLVPYQAGTFVSPAFHGVETFPIYDSATREEDCTAQDDAEVRLGRAKAVARRAGIEMDARLVPTILESNLTAIACAGPSPCILTSRVLTPLILRVEFAGVPSQGASRLQLSVEAHGNGSALRATAAEQGKGLEIRPAELYRFEHRSVLLFAFRQGSGPEHPQLLVLESPPAPSTLPPEDADLLAPLVVQGAPGTIQH
jgi:hypothetical protein